MTSDKWEQFLTALWRHIPVNEDCVNVAECPHCRVTPDIYATGDSPTGYECTAASASNCPRLFESPCATGIIAEKVYNNDKDL